MLLIHCPHCGPRNSSEFHYGGEVVDQPGPHTADPAEWRDYLYIRRNPAGPTAERWFHRAGCRRVLTVLRDSRTNEILEVSPVVAASDAAPAAAVGGRP